MWLIHAREKVLVAANWKPLPPYAILSHVWEKEKQEVTFQDMQDPEKASGMETFSKIRETCELALKENLEYIWVDTCCINKQDSTELSEAINSMYCWYEAAKLCYVLLADVHSSALNYRGGSFYRGFADTNLALEIRGSKWFKRGWTLQELIAPENVVFVNRYWKELGTKKTLATILRQETGIPEVILRKPHRLSSQSVAQRMSWASDRETTRDEDHAYCLLGLFGVNMPMLYGEGKRRAFLRLQEEIIRRTDDHSLFAWDLPVPQSLEKSLHGLLAQSPQAFKHCREVRKTTSRKGRSAYTVTNRGLSIKLTATLWSMDTYLVKLHCDDNTVAASDGADEDNSHLGILLTRLYEDDQFARVATASGESFVRLSDDWWSRNGPDSQEIADIHINVPQDPDQVIVDSMGERHLQDLRTRRVCGLSLPDHEMFRLSSEDTNGWNSEDRIMEMGQLLKSGQAVCLEIKAPESKVKIRKIKVGFDFDFNPTCFVATRSGLKEFYPATSKNHEVSADSSHKLLHRPSIYNRDEEMACLGIGGRRVLDNTAWTAAWSKIDDDDAAELRLHPGLWALKGDRLDGLNVRLYDWTEKNGFGELCIKRVAIKSGDREGHLVWQLSLTVREEPE